MSITIYTAFVFVRSIVTFDTPPHSKPVEIECLNDLTILDRQQGFGADVSQHVGSRNVGNVKQRGFELIADQVKDDINVFGVLLVKGIDCE